MRKPTSTYSLNEKTLNDNCGMAYTLTVIGGRWKASILHKLLKRKLRFKELKQSLPEVSERMLSLQLRELENDQIIRRTVYAEVPTRVEYELTERGWTLEPILLQMARWGEEHR